MTGYYFNLQSWAGLRSQEYFYFELLEGPGDIAGKRHAERSRLQGCQSFLGSFFDQKKDKKGQLTKTFFAMHKA